MKCERETRMTGGGGGRGEREKEEEGWPIK